MNLAPTGDRILIKPVEAESTTASGLIIPDVAKEQGTTAHVVAVGPGRVESGIVRAPMEVSVGDEVIFAKYSGVKIDVEGVEHLIVRDGDILAIVR